MWMTTWPKISGPVLVRSHFSACWLIELTNEGKFGWTTSPRPPQWQQYTNTSSQATRLENAPQGVQDECSGSSAHAGQSKLRTRLDRAGENKKKPAMEERERDLYFSVVIGTRYQDTTWPAAYEPARRGYDEGAVYEMDYGCWV